MKLNYKNRRSDGPKLGHIVAKDLRKQTRHCFAKADPRPEPSPLVLDLDGKALTDEGCLAMIEGLAETLEPRDGVAANKLEELHLKGNLLTTTSVRALARVVDLARFDLADLDLSDNLIRVVSNEEAGSWETFLGAFAGCRVLRRIDLSGNTLHGPRAFEIFARVYAKQHPIDPTQLDVPGIYGDDHQSSVQSDGSLSPLTARARTLSIKSPTDHLHFPMPYGDTSTGTTLERGEGLRAIPYIILSNTAMTDAGVLFFSYVLQRHYYPQQLMCRLKPGPQAMHLEEYRHKSNCWGLVYLPNHDLTETGLRLLAKAEDLREQFAGFGEDLALARESQLDSRLRRASNASSLKSRSDTATEPGKKHAIALDIENYRKKIQRNILEELGYESIDLWRCAVKMLTYAKVVMLGHEQGDESPLPTVDALDPIMQMVHSRACTCEVTVSQPSRSDTVLAANGASAHPASLDMKLWPGLPPPTGIPAPHAVTMSASIENNDCCGHDSDLLRGISEDVWRDILVEAAGGQSILSSTQQKSVMQYVLDRTTASLEKSELGKPKPFKLWWILERMGCLAYETGE